MATKKPAVTYQFEDPNPPAIWESVLKALLISRLSQQEVVPD